MLRTQLEMPDVRGIGEEARAALWPRAVAAMQDVVILLVNAIKVKVGGRGSGRLYRRGKRGRVHQASAPGHAPARDTGAYVNSWAFDVTERRDEIEGQIGSSMWDTRGSHLEHGTRRMQPRPHVAPAIEENRAAVESRLGEIG